MTEQEQQLLEIFREWQSMTQNYQIVIEHTEGAWDITMEEVGTGRVVHGTGTTLEVAWDSMDVGSAVDDDQEVLQ